jgi:ferredoxin
MAIKRVWIEEGCIVCGLCEATAPEVFEMEDETAVVKEGVNFEENEEAIKESAENCPVEVIKYK